MGALLHKVTFLSVWLVASSVFADVVIGPAPGNAGETLNQIEAHVRLLEAQEPSIPDHRRPQLSRRAARLADLLQRVSDKIDFNGHSFGEWLAAPGQECSNFCRSQGRESVLSPEGAQCVSGEARPASAVGVVPFTYGCWPNCGSEGAVQPVSVGRFCYKPGQKRDNDRTDTTVGCFCR